MQPYEGKHRTDLQQVLDYRLSHFCRITENAFDICSSRFCLFLKRATLAPGQAEIIVMASLALHNLLRKKSKDSYTPVGFIDQYIEGSITNGSWRYMATPDIIPLEFAPRARNISTTGAKKEKFCNYFNGPGQVP